MVIAATCAVLCTSAAFIVGAAGDPQALRIRLAKMMRVEKERRFILCEYLLMNLAIGETSAPGFDAVILHNNCPVALCDAETAECFKVLFAGDKRAGAISPNGSRETISRNDEISTLTQVSHYIHGEDNRPFRFRFVCDAEVCRRSLPGCERLIAIILRASTAGACGG